MLKYTFKRILVFIPMLIAISLLSFIISVNAPGDPVERLSKAAGTEGSAEQQSGASKKIKQERYDLFMKCFDHVSNTIDEIYKCLAKNQSAQGV